MKTNLKLFENDISIQEYNHEDFRVKTIVTSVTSEWLNVQETGQRIVDGIVTIRRDILG